MKSIKIFIIFVFFTQGINAQKIDSIPISSLPTLSKGNETQKKDLVGSLGPSLVNIGKFNYILIVNNFLIRDTTISKMFLERLSGKIKKIKRYSSTRGMKKFGISSKWGILFCKLKNDAIIDIESMQGVSDVKQKKFKN